jgi:hypothetical protein
MPLNESYDSGDLDAMQDLEISRGWELVRDRIAGELERKQVALEGDGDFQEVCELRGYIRALRMVLQIPEIRKDEIKQQLREKR